MFLLQKLKMNVYSYYDCIATYLFNLNLFLFIFLFMLQIKYQRP